LVAAWMGRLRRYTLGTSIGTSWVTFAFAAYGAVRLVRLPNPALRLVFLWGAVHTALYATLLPTPGHGGRYEPFVPLLFVASVVAGTAFVAWDVTRVLARRARLDVLVAGAVLWITPLYYGASAMKRANDLAVRHIEATEIATGTFVRTLPPD